ncbi:hypothetical protein K7432_013308 [Basidiobolus ranarum]|uniref:Uncharacterized protein n=1 Tax=Basidiobolus ranarum TaxID=34480 RepID=A0ABR2WJL7_9FUNG
MLYSIPEYTDISKTYSESLDRTILTNSYSPPLMCASDSTMLQRGPNTNEKCSKDVHFSYTCNYSDLSWSAYGEAENDPESNSTKHTIGDNFIDYPSSLSSSTTTEELGTITEDLELDLELDESNLCHNQPDINQTSHYSMHQNISSHNHDLTSSEKSTPSHAMEIALQDREVLLKEVELLRRLLKAEIETKHQISIALENARQQFDDISHISFLKLKEASKENKRLTNKLKYLNKNMTAF